MDSRTHLRIAGLLVFLVCCASPVSRPAEAARTTSTITVLSGGDLQKAINDAQPGDVILLPAGARFVGQFRLPKKSGNDWVTIRTAGSIFHRLPSQGTRVTPADAAGMAKILAPSGSALTADAGAHHFRFLALEIAPLSGVYVTNLIDLGEVDRLDAVAHDIDFERCYIHGDPVAGSRRGIALNSGETTIADSYFSDFKEVGADSQAIAGWNGPGPFHIINNFLQGAGENILFGGADPSIANLVPSDIEIARNTLSKPLEWKIGDPRYQGTPWTIKNLLELKNARRVHITGNILEYHWPQAQNGFSILFTVRNQDGAAPWSTVEDVTFSDNIVRHVAAGINILGQDDIHQSQQAKRIVVQNNLFLDVSQHWGFGRLFQILNGTDSVTIDHNTALQTETMLFGGDTLPHTHFVFTNNIAPHNDYGIIGSGTGVGKPTIDRYFPGSVIRRNVIAGGNASLYPSDNFFPGSVNDVKWIDAASGNYRLAPASDYRNKGTDGKDPGADVSAIDTAMAQSGAGTARPESVRLDGPAGPAVTGASLGWPGAVPLTRAAELTFIVSAGLLLYIYAGYAAAIWLASKVRPKGVTRAAIVPSVSILVIACNEGARIERRIRNLLALDYPVDRLEIVVASDGSSDDTGARAGAFGGRVRVVECPVRRGKPAILNDLVPSLRADIVVLADARQAFASSAVKALVSDFADASVGAVSGELILLPDDAGEATADGAAVYWNYEKIVRASESQVDSTIGATGAIYAIRRSLFEPIPEDTILDDVLIPLRIARQGFRVLFEPGARAYDRVMPTARQEFVRKTRTMAGNVQLFARERWLLRPSENRLFFQTCSHKALRLLLPALYLVMFAANVTLADHPVYRATLAAQSLFYLVALLGYAAPALRRSLPLFVVPYELCFLNWTVIVGVVRYVTKRQRVTWDRPPISATS